MVKHHRPKKLPANLDYGVFAKELADAQYSIGLLEGSQRNLQNPSLLIAPLSAKEAAVSSRIEGTQSTASDIFVYEAGGEPKYPDTPEVVNYRQAMNHAITEIKKGRELSTHFVKTLHNVLLKGTRHKGELGEFRKGPVWIAERPGDPIEKAIYIPPEPHFVSDYMQNLFEYLEKGSEKTLVQAGVVHYQFEAIHPFEDGNGRIGRLLIPLLLHYKNQISMPIIYLSGYFDENRDQYLESLHAVDKSGEYEIWLKFFLSAVAKQSKQTQELIDNIYKLHADIKERFKLNKSPYLRPFLELLFKRPIFTTPMITKELGLSRLTAIRLIKLFENEKIITSLENRQGKAKLFAFDGLLKILM